MMSNLDPLQRFNVAQERPDSWLTSDLKHGGGGGTSGEMDGRISRLEAHMEHIQEDMREVKADLKVAIGYLSVLPQKRDLDTWRWQWIATGVAIIGLTVGGITGGLALIARFAG